MTELWDLEIIIKGYVVNENEKKSYPEGNITSTIVYVECYKRFLSVFTVFIARGSQWRHSCGATGFLHDVRVASSGDTLLLISY